VIRLPLEGIPRVATTAEEHGHGYKALHDEAAALRPKCGEATTLVCHVQKLAKKGTQDYEFIAEISCTTCTHRSVLRRVLDQLGRIKRISVTVAGTGVELERDPGPQHT
jgi:hypothetical protein